MSKVIVLDAGHGMNTSGKRCLKSLDKNETREWWLNDRIMDLVGAQLKAYDCIVIRSDDTAGKKDVSLASRVKTANNKKAAAFISMHHDAGIEGGKGGGTTVHYNKAEDKALAQNLYESIIAETGLAGNRCQKIIKSDFYVIENTTMPAFLVENGFMDSATDVPIILSEAHAAKTANGVVNFLVKEFSLKKKEIVPVQSDQSAVPFKIKVANVPAGDVLNIRKEPNANAKKTGKLKYNDPNIYTIVEVKNGWGKLKSGIGWINLTYTKRVQV